MLNLTKEQFGNQFDLALLSQNLQQADIDQGVKDAAKYNVRSMNVQPCWVAYANDQFEAMDTPVRASAVAAFPHGANTTVGKLREVEEMIGARASAVDMVTNIGAVLDGRWDHLREETKAFADMCREANVVSKLILEVGFLNLEQIGRLTQIICETGVDYAKTATGTQAFPDMPQVQAMQDNLSGATKIKVSGVPRTFALAAAMFIFENFDCDLIGTRSAGKITDAYMAFKEKQNA